MDELSFRRQPRLEDPLRSRCPHRVAGRNRRRNQRGRCSPRPADSERHRLRRAHLRRFRTSSITPPCAIPAGQFVKASLDSIIAAVPDTSLGQTRDSSLSILNAPGRNAYPISAFTWILDPGAVLRCPQARGDHSISSLDAYFRTEGMRGTRIRPAPAPHRDPGTRRPESAQVNSVPRSVPLLDQVIARKSRESRSVP